MRFKASRFAAVCFDATWSLGAAAICAVMMKRLGWGEWAFLGLPAFLFVAAIWLNLGRRLRPNNREEEPPPKYPHRADDDASLT